MLSATAVLLAVSAWALFQGASTAARVLVDTNAVVGVLVGNVALLAFRVAATVHAFDAARSSHGSGSRHAGWSRLGVVALVTLVVVALVAPHALAGYYLVRTHEMVTRVFATDPSAERGRAEFDVPSPAAGIDDRDTDAGSAGVDDADDEPGDPPSREPTERTTPNRWDAAGRLTVAVLGLDAGPGRSIARTDAIIVITIDTETGAGAIFSVDRYVRGFPVPDHFVDLYDEHCATGGAWDYINALHTCARERIPDEFAERYEGARDPAAAAVTDTLELLLDLDIDHYALVDMEGFVRVIDALGGIEIDLAEPIRVRVSPAHDDTDWRTFDMPSGVQTFDGETALAYARMRDPGDAPRMRRQRCLLASLADRTSVGRVLRRLPTITSAIEDHVVTDLPLSALPDLVEVLVRLDHDHLVAAGIGPPVYRDSDHRPQLDRIHAHVDEVLNDPLSAIEEGRSTETADDACGIA